MAANDKKFVALLPENLQLKILSLVTNSEGGRRPAEPPPSTTKQTEGLAPGDQQPRAALLGLRERLRSHGYAWEDDFVPASLAIALHAGAQAVQPALLPAGMSSSAAKWRDASVRGDLTAWLPLEGDPTPEHASLCGTAAWAHVRQPM